PSPVFNAEDSCRAREQPIHVRLAAVPLSFFFLKLCRSPRCFRVLPSTPCRDVLQSSSAYVKYANSGWLLCAGILQKQQSHTVLIKHVSAINLILTSDVLKPLRNSLVVCGNPPGHCIQRAFFVESNRFTAFDAHDVA